VLACIIGRRTRIVAKFFINYGVTRLRIQSSRQPREAQPRAWNLQVASKRHIPLRQRAIFMLNCDVRMQKFDRSWRVADEACRVSRAAGETTRSLSRRDTAELVTRDLCGRAALKKSGLNRVNFVISLLRLRDTLNSGLGLPIR
jgi:hypothetical protein